MVYPLLIRTFRLTLSKTFPTLAVLFTGILFSHQLDPSVYGHYLTIWVTAGVGTLISVWGFPSIILAFGTRLSESVSRRISLHAILLTAVLSPVFAGMMGFLDPSWPVSMLALLSVFFFSQSLFYIQESWMISRKGETFLQWLNTGYAVLFFGIHWVVLQTGFDLFNLIAALTVLSIARNAILFSARKKQLEVITEDIPIYQHWLMFGLNDSFQILSRWLDKLVILAIAVPADFAVYYNGTFEIPFVGLVMNAVAAVLTSVMAEKIKANFQAPAIIFRASTALMSGLIFPGVWLLFTNREWLVVTLFSSQYEGSVLLFGISVWMMVFRIGAFNTLLQVNGQSKELVTGAIIDNVFVLLPMYPLYLLFGLAGLALSILIGGTAQGIYILVKGSKKAEMKFSEILNWGRLGFRFLISGLVIGLSGWMLLSLGFENLPVLLITVFLTGVLSLWWLRKDLSRYGVGLKTMVNGK